MVGTATRDFPVKLEDARRRLPIVDELPPSRSRRVLPQARGEAPKPRFAVWELTLACDHRCRHCGPRAGKPRDNELTTEECLQLVAELAAIGVGEVSLIGGEPYLRNDFILIIRAIREHAMTASMVTGGLNLTQARAQAAVEAGISNISVSIDGLAPTHNYLRNHPDSFARAVSALRHLKAAGATISSNTQINRKTWRELPQLLELFAKLGVYAWQIQLTSPHGNAADLEHVLLQPYQLPEVFDLLAKLADRARQLGVRLIVANSVGYFGPYAHRLRGNQNTCGHFLGCHAGAWHLAIESDGNIKNCPSLGGPPNVGGSWREHGLRDLWERAPEITYMRHRSRDELWGYCRECYYATTCMGGCTSVSEPLMGRPGNNPMCHHRALEMAAMGLRERVECSIKAEPGPFGQGGFRLIREFANPELREMFGPVQVDHPRTTRTVDRWGIGREVAAAGACDDPTP